ncbi:glycosyltransferase family 4 protein [Grimontia sp. SpTr1]|uniref:glycosyltransferase family 4 protein n=1 Tax=Grimontia sp. SpTr1 TaxID=2995319 RepID=UPI00248BC106|nr:glycosyltransferase family 4 protein [Grimontia sp. SpTr1]
MKAKLLLVSNMYPSAHSPSFGVFIKDIYDAFSFTRFNKKLCAINKDEKSKVKKTLSYLEFYLKILARVISFRPDYLYCHYVSHVIYIPVILKILGFKFKLVSHVHGSDVHGKSNMVFRFLSYSDVIVVPSRLYADYIKTMLNRDVDIVIYASGGVPDFFFINEARDFKKSVGFVGFVGRLESVKRPDRFRSLIDSAITRNVGAKFQVVGKGSLKGIFCGVEDHIQMHESIPREDLPSLIRTFDFLIVTSDRESLCLAALEAMANGVVVIANDCGGVTEYLIHEHNGFVVDMSSSGWVEEVLELLNIETETYTTISNNARETAKNYQSSVVNKRFIDNVFN